MEIDDSLGRAIDRDYHSPMIGATRSVQTDLYAFEADRDARAYVARNMFGTLVGMAGRAHLRPCAIIDDPIDI